MQTRTLLHEVIICLIKLRYQQHRSYVFTMLACIYLFLCILFFARLATEAPSRKWNWPCYDKQEITDKMKAASAASVASTFLLLQAPSQLLLFMSYHVFCANVVVGVTVYDTGSLINLRSHLAIMLSRS